MTVSKIDMPDSSSGLYPIHLAVKNANLPAVKCLLKWDVKLNVQDNEGNTVYHHAAESNKDIILVRKCI